MRFLLSVSVSESRVDYSIKKVEKLTSCFHSFGTLTRRIGNLRRPYSLILTFEKGGRSGGIRTPDILLPKQARYQTALHSDFAGLDAAKVITSG